jgi:hypothetical protein
MNNEKSLKVVSEIASKQDELAAKHGIKIVGGWQVHSEHLVIQVFEAPSFDAFQAYSMEPEMMNVMNLMTTEVKVAMTLEETWQMMQQMMQAK